MANSEAIRLAARDLDKMDSNDLDQVIKNLCNELDDKALRMSKIDKINALLALLDASQDAYIETKSFMNKQLSKTYENIVSEKEG